MGEMGGSGSAEVEWHPDVYSRFYPCIGLIVLCERSGGVWERAKVLKAPKDVRVLHLFCWLMVMVILLPRLVVVNAFPACSSGNSSVDGWR
jgi:hypothetical protein